MLKRQKGQRRRRMGAVLAVAAVIAAVTVSSTLRPARILAPQLLGLTCLGRLCTDQPDRIERVQRLYHEAFAANQRLRGDAPQPRRVVFCATERCYHTFGTTRSTANTIADLGIVIGPQGWCDFYVRPELIHDWQAYHLGLIKCYRDPRWLIEGMAYALSDDPRPLLVEPNQSYRDQFQSWYETIDPADLWTAAAKVVP